jgi:hypothetical protein
LFNVLGAIRGRKKWSAKFEFPPAQNGKQHIHGHENFIISENKVLALLG